MRVLLRCLAVLVLLTAYHASLGRAKAAPAYCSPQTNAARILTRPLPNAIHPDWSGGSYVGTGWTLIPKSTVTNNTGTYVKGDLRSARGGVVNRNVFILQSEWDCVGTLSDRSGEQSSAQSDPSGSRERACPAITFQANTVIISGVAPPEGQLCYRLDARQGEGFTLKVHRGDNTVFSIAGLADAQDGFTFTAEEKSYRVSIGQMMRSTRPQPFRISIERFAVPAAGLSSWPTSVAHDPKRVSTQQRAASGELIALACNKSLGSGTGISLYEYKGRALDRTDDVSRPVTFVVTKPSHQDVSFPARMHYFAPDKAWVLTDDLPTGFLLALSGGAELHLQNGRGEKVSTFNLKNVEAFSRKALEVCAGRPETLPVSPRSEGPPISNDTSTDISRSCDGRYIYFNVNDTKWLTPIFGKKIEADKIDLSAPNASWFNIKCDAFGRPISVVRYSFGRKEYTLEYEYVGESVFVSKIVAKNSDDFIRSTSTVFRDPGNQLARIDVSSPKGKLERFAVYENAGERQVLRTTNALTKGPISRAEKWFYPDGRLRRAKWYYPQYGYDYSYDHGTGLIISQDKFDNRGSFEKTVYEYDSFMNTLRRQSDCFASRCNAIKADGIFIYGLMTRETTIFKTGERRVWENKYSQDRSLEGAELSVDGRFAVRFAVERNGTTVLRTVAYAPDGRVLFVYYDRAIVHINRDGSPVDGGRFERVRNVNAW